MGGWLAGYQLNTDTRDDFLFGQYQFPFTGNAQTIFLLGMFDDHFRTTLQKIINRDAIKPVFMPRTPIVGPGRTSLFI
jgi:hypothetical protein